MSNTPEENLNSTPVYSNPFDITECLEKNNFGFLISCCVTTICFLIGIPANSWCLWFYFCIERKIKQTQVFLLNHIVLELLFCLACAGEEAYVFFWKNVKVYEVVHFFLCLSWSGRPVIQICICVEQYLAVRHPITFLRYKGMIYRNVAAVAVWLMSLGYAVYNLITATYPDPFTNSLFIVTLIVISFCCVSVLCALKHPGPGDRRRDVRNQQKRKAFDTIFTALLLILFSYFPQGVLTIITSYYKGRMLIRCNVVPFLTSFYVFGVMVTPLLKMYKEGYFKCLKCYMGGTVA